MKIKFAGTHSADEVVDSLSSILRLFQDQYGIGDFHEIKINLTLVKDGEEVELIDASTSEIFDQLEVHKNQQRAQEDYHRMLMSNDPSDETVH